MFTIHFLCSLLFIYMILKGICEWRIKLRWKFDFAINQKKSVPGFNIKVLRWKEWQPVFQWAFGSFSFWASLLISVAHLPSVGSEPLDKLAHRIWQSVGPSGPNKVSLTLGMHIHKILIFPLPSIPVHRITFLNSLNQYANSLHNHMIPSSRSWSKALPFSSEKQN